jgi:hypothetical protein
VQVGPELQDLQVGDLVVRTYGEGQRPTALIVGWYKPNIYRNTAEVIWQGTNKVTQFNAEHLKVINASR